MCPQAATQPPQTVVHHHCEGPGFGQGLFPPPCRQGPQVRDKRVTWTQGTAGSHAMTQATVALWLLACLSLSSPRPCQLPTSFGASPMAWQGARGRSRAGLREPPAQQAPGRGRMPVQQQINVPPQCDGAVMETVSWKPFPADGKPPLAPTAPWPAPPGLHGDPHQSAHP